MLISCALVESPGKKALDMRASEPSLLDGKPEPNVWEVFHCMAKSVRATVKDARLVLFGDKSPRFEEVDDTIDMPYSGKLQMYRMQAMLRAAELLSDQNEVWCHVDFDVLFLRDPTGMLDKYPFECAQHARNWSNNETLAKLMPFNGGVTFGRGTTVPELAIRFLEYYKESRGVVSLVEEEWFGDQLAFGAVSKCRPFLPLPDLLNYTPQNELDDIPPNVYIAHFKGPKRKRWMIDYCAKHFQH